MATPVGHTLCGAAVYFGLRWEDRWDLPLLLGILVFANLPDIDYVPGLLVGKPSVFHHGPTHSLLFVVLAGAAAAAVIGRRDMRRCRNLCLAFVLAGLLHLLVDYFTVDQSFPFGEQLFWPFSKAYFLSSGPVFRDVYKGSTIGDMMRMMFHPHNLVTGLTELAVFAPAAGLVSMARRRRERRRLGGKK